MASGAGAKPSGHKKIVTYGKPSRKRQIRENLPVRPVGPNPVASPNPSSSPFATTSDNAAAIATTSNLRLSNKMQRREGLNQDSLTESTDDSIVKKRKRSQMSLLDRNEGPRTAPYQGRGSQAQHGSLNTIQNPHDSPVTGSKRSHASKTTALPPKSISEAKLTSSTLQTQGVTTNSPGLSRGQVHQHEESEPRKRRARLIDTLVAQRSASPESESDSGLVSDSDNPSPPLRNMHPSMSHELQPVKVSQSPRPRLKGRPGTMLQGNKVRKTYGEVRSILNDSQDRGVATQSGSGDDLDALLATPPGLNNDDPFAMDDEDGEDANSQPAIKSVHELRRAGANNRFADEMEDILARIGSPSPHASTVRRNALLDLAQKLQRKDFISQFRDHATRDKVVHNISHEEDIICGFTLAAILVEFLTFTQATHLLGQLVNDDIEILLRRLLRVQSDIEIVATNSSAKLPRTTRTSLASVKRSLLGSNIWNGHTPQDVSPRALALQVLNIICQRLDVAISNGIVQNLGQDLSAIVKQYSKVGREDDAELVLILSILEIQSSLVMDDNEEPLWISEQSSEIVHLLQSALKQWPHGPSDILSTTLKLSINTSNTTQGAQAFNDARLLASLTKCIATGFGLSQDAISNRRLRGETYDGLLLILGVTINILEHCPAARASLDETSLDSLASLYLDNRSLTSEADSVEKSQLSVAFGYLAVLLGYLALSLPVGTVLNDKAKGRGLNELIDSIQEFIGMYKSVGSKVQGLEGLVSELRLHR